MALQLAVAALPVAVLGWRFQDQFERYGRDPRVIATFSVVFGVLLWLADRYGRHRSGIADLYRLAKNRS